mmetsp:Transcript_1371/g.5212  ORF Transcript_1371/g.5212 Transcript_1371/m.5212 type:complete len:304 (+) Transcript_1371:969-1880(+)
MALAFVHGRFKFRDAHVTLRRLLRKHLFHLRLAHFLQLADRHPRLFCLPLHHLSLDLPGLRDHRVRGAVRLPRVFGRVCWISSGRISRRSRESNITSVRTSAVSMSTSALPPGGFRELQTSRVKHPLRLLLPAQSALLDDFVLLQGQTRVRGVAFGGLQISSDNFFFRNPERVRASRERFMFFTNILRLQSAHGNPPRVRPPQQTSRPRRRGFLAHAKQRLPVSAPGRAELAVVCVARLAVVRVPVSDAGRRFRFFAVVAVARFAAVRVRVRTRHLVDPRVVRGDVLRAVVHFYEPFNSWRDA